MLKPSKHGVTIWKDTNTKCSSLQTTTTFIASWIPRARALNRSARPKSSPDTIFELTTTRAKQMHEDALSRFLQRSQDEKDELQAENGQIFYYLQNSLTNASLARLNLPSSLPSHLHQVLICGTYVLPQLCHFWDGLQNELASKGPYKASIGGMRLRLQELQSEDKQAWKLRAEQPVKDG